MRYIASNKLCPGDTLGCDLYDTSTAVLLNRGCRLTASNIRSIIARGIEKVPVFDNENEDIIITNPLNGKTEREILSALENVNIDRICQKARQMVDEIIKRADTIADVEFIKSYDAYTYEHCVSVGYLSTIVALAAGFSQEELTEICCAGILHDIGKVQIDKDIINAPRKLTDEEYRRVQQHSELGSRLLYGLSEPIQTAVFEHHENEDGSGYPKQKSGNQIHRYAKIIHICDVFDALTTLRPYKEAMSRKEAKRYIKVHIGSMFDPFFAKIFDMVVPSYVTGTEIEIVAGVTGIVVKNVATDVDNPYVRILKTGQVVRLIERRV